MYPKVGDLWPVWWDTNDGKPAGQHEARILGIRKYDGDVDLGMTHVLKLALPEAPRGYTEMSVAWEPEDTQFRLGNCLRGHFEGWFVDAETAWEVLSQRFLLSYPVEEGSTGRHVQMYVFEENRYGLSEWVLCRDQNTATDGMLARQDVLDQCKRCDHYA